MALYIHKATHRKSIKAEIAPRWINAIRTIIEAKVIRFTGIGLERLSRPTEAGLTNATELIAVGWANESAPHIEERAEFLRLLYSHHLLTKIAKCATIER